jgi:hypothetical protein
MAGDELYDEDENDHDTYEFPLLRKLDSEPLELPSGLAHW